MKVVVDANVVFSCILRSDGSIGALLLNNDAAEFYAPEFLKQEVRKHRTKLLRLSKLSEGAIDLAISQTIRSITFIEEAAVEHRYRAKAEALIADVDVFDVPYVALALQLKCRLWTGDKRLHRGLLLNGFEDVISTEEFGPLLEGAG